MSSVRALACPSSLKGVLGAAAAAAALGEGFGRAGVAADELLVADGGEGTLEALHAALDGEWREAEVSDAFGRPRRARWLLLPEGTGVIESAEAIPLDAARLDPFAASSRGLGELILAALSERPPRLLVGLGGTANVDGGVGLLDVIDSLPVPTRVACDVRSPLADAARVFARQKGATDEQIIELEERLLGIEELAPVRGLPGAGAAGGLGAAFAALGAELVPGPELILETIGFRERLRGAALAVTGEGALDRTTLEGKAPLAVLAACRAEGVPCAVFAGRIEPEASNKLLQAFGGVAEVCALSGEPGRAREDLVALGERLGHQLS
jgi:glycerate 2-kinase